jgi:integrase
VPVTGRLTATLEGYIAAAHPTPESSDYVFYSVAAGRPVNQSTVYVRFRGYLADAGIPHFTGGPHPHSLRHGFAVANQVSRVALDATFTGLGECRLPGTQRRGCIAVTAAVGVTTRG